MPQLVICFNSPCSIYPDPDGRLILRLIFRKWVVGGTEWIELAQDRDRWRELVNAVMNLGVP